MTMREVLFNYLSSRAARRKSNPHPAIEIPRMNKSSPKFSKSDGAFRGYFTSSVLVILTKIVIWMRSYMKLIPKKDRYLYHRESNTV